MTGTNEPLRFQSRESSARFLLMGAVAELQQLPLHEKLLAMEALWEGIASEEAELKVPEWHKSILDEWQRFVEEGKAHFIDWETAKKQLRSDL